nr:FHA domain-containing protein [Brevibacterium yomogidense]
MRFALFGLLWLFVFLIAGVLRQDLFGPRVARNRRDRRRGRAAAEAPVAAGMGAASPTPQQSAFGSSPTLVVTSGRQSGFSLLLSAGQLTIGRADDCGFVIEDDFASSHHARIYPQAGAWVVEDTGSTNGTFVGSARLSQPTRIEPGMPITIGHTTMELRA